MRRVQETRFLVLVTDRTEIAPNYLKVGVVTGVVPGHLEHAEMEVCDGAEGPTCDQNDRLLGRVSENAVEAVRGEGVAWRVVEGRCGPTGGHC